MLDSLYHQPYRLHMIPRILLCLLLAIYAPQVSFAQPGTDCSTPFPITSLPFTQAGMTTAGFGDDYSTSPCGNPFMGGDDFVMTYTPISDEKITILLENVDAWTGLHVMDQCPDVATDCIASDLSPTPGNRLIADLLLQGGTVYYFIVSTFPDPQSTAFDLTFLSNGPPAEGTSCTNPKVISDLPFAEQNINTADFGNNYSGTGPCQTSAYLNGNEVVYTYTPSTNQSVAIELTNLSDLFGGVHVMSDCPDASPVCIGSAVNAADAGDLLIDNLFLEMGQTYYIVVSTFADPLSIRYDINIQLQQSCTPPAGISADNITSTSALLSWLDDALFWTYEVVEAGASPTGVGGTTNNPIVALNLLDPESDYDFYLRSHCAPASLMISGIYDGPRPNGTPKGVELYALHNITDLSAYGFGSANNGQGSAGQEFTFPAISVAANTYLYLATDSVEFEAFFGFFPDFNSSAAGINGNDAVELFFNGQVIDQFGFTDVDGAGEIWDYQDGWAARNTGQRNNDGLFNPARWTYSGINELEGGATNATCDRPFPLGLFKGAATIASEWSGPFAFRTKPTPPACDGFFVDEGGFSGNYFSNSIDSVTICPDNPDDLVALKFTSFALENDGQNCLDELLIYDGPDTSASLIASPDGNTDGWCWDENSTGAKGSGNLSGMTIQSTHDSGCLTFIFSSNASEQLQGWEASVNCIPPQECDMPTNLDAAQISNNFAELTWQTASMSSLQTTLSWGPSGILPQSGTQVIVTGNSYQLSGLSPLTAYDFYVSEDCGTSGASDWAGPFTFTTLSCSILGDSFSSPIEISALPFTYFDNTAQCFTNTSSEMSADIFFSYTTGACEYSLYLSTCSDLTEFDTYLYLFAANGTLIAANDESPEGTCDLTLNGENRFSVLEVAVAPNTTYLVMVEGFGPNAGNFELLVEEGNISPVDIGWTSEDITCWNDSDGSITLNPQGGASPYTIDWSTGANTEMLSDLPAGPYLVTVTDACDHSNTATIMLTNPDSLSVIATGFPTDLGQDNGYVVAEVTGGEAPYSYVWDDGTATSTIINRGVGGYCVRVTDARGCSAVACGEVSVNTAIPYLPGLETLVLSPNPTSDRALLTLSFSQTAAVKIELIDLAGRVQFSQQTLPIQSEQIVLPLEDLPSGIYGVKIETEEGMLIRRLVKQ